MPRPYDIGDKVYVKFYNTASGKKIASSEPAFLGIIQDIDYSTRKINDYQWRHPERSKAKYHVLPIGNSRVHPIWVWHYEIKYRIDDEQK